MDLALGFAAGYAATKLTDSVERTVRAVASRVPEPEGRR
jgi:hypothetical protein